ncbi:hypothetical protein BDW72DRAFT_180855 [Aspergillus terricola var. indicus]
MSAPCISRSRTPSIFPLKEARIIGVQPSLFLSSKSAAERRRCWAILVWPYSKATYNGLHPLIPLVLTSAPLSRSRRTRSRWPQCDTTSREALLASGEPFSSTIRMNSLPLWSHAQ